MIFGTLTYHKLYLYGLLMALLEYFSLGGSADNSHLDEEENIV